MYIAENLRALRKGKDMTQEEVANILGVSPQSVSKWERGDTYPDITLLPSLSNLYETSLDALIGMERINNAEERAAIYMRGQKHLREGDNEGAATIYTEALKLYPDDQSIMLELALVLALDNESKKLEQALSLCERLLSDRSTENILYTARAALCYIYLKMGEKEKAANAAQKLPHARVGREKILAEIDKDPDQDEINAYLDFINFREKAEYDILVIDFGIDMLPIVTEKDLLVRISELRNSLGKDDIGRSVMPGARVMDNIDLPPDRVRVRYYDDYLLDESFPDTEGVVDEIIGALRKIAE